jgi:hypothetical protein
MHLAFSRVKILSVMSTASLSRLSFAEGRFECIVSTISETGTMLRAMYPKMLLGMRDSVENKSEDLSVEGMSHMVIWLGSNQVDYFL